MPWRPHSRAAVRVSAAIAAFAALYSPRPASPRSAASDTMLTIRPAPRAAMCGRTAHIAHHVPLTPLVHDRSNCASGMSSSGARAPKPWALFTRTSTPPQRAAVSATIRSTSARTATSTTAANASPPAAQTSATVRSARCGFSSATQTRAPSRPNASAIPRPMPCPAPVTTAILPVRRPTPASLHRAWWSDNRSRHAALRAPGSRGSSKARDARRLHEAAGAKAGARREPRARSRLVAVRGGGRETGRRRPAHPPRRDPLRHVHHRPHLQVHGGLVSVYDNKSPVDQDAMATMLFYLEDKEFKKPAIAR